MTLEPITDNPEAYSVEMNTSSVTLWRTSIVDGKPHKAMCQAHAGNHKSITETIHKWCTEYAIEPAHIEGLSRLKKLFIEEEERRIENESNV